MTWNAAKALEESNQWNSWLTEHLPSSMLGGMEDESVGFIIDTLRHFRSIGGANLSLDGEIAIVVADSDDALIDQIGELVNYNISRVVMRSFEGVTPSGEQSLRIARMDLSDSDRCMVSGLPKKSELRSKLYENCKRDCDDLSSSDFEALLSRFERVFLEEAPFDDVSHCLQLLHRSHLGINVKAEVIGDVKKDGSCTIALANRRSSRTGFFYNLLRTIRSHGFKVKGIQSIYLPKDRQDESLLNLFELSPPEGLSKKRKDTLRGRVLESMAVAQWFEFENPMNQDLMEKKGFSIHHTMLLRSMQEFVHQMLAQVNPHLYSPESIHEAFMKHPAIAEQLLGYFRARFNPVHRAKEKDLSELYDEVMHSIDSFDSGIPVNDDRRRTVLRLAADFVTHILKTNYYVLRRSGLSFRLDPKVMLKVPFDRMEDIYPELPNAIFFIKGKNFIAFNIRFRELARGGVRTLLPMDDEKRAYQHRDVFKECYMLAYTQQRKNKDIPEGGSKSVIFVKKYSGFERDLELEESIIGKVMDKQSLSAAMEERRLTTMRRQLFDSQQSFCDSLLDILIWNEAEHKLVEENVVDYVAREELVFLGPDENMLNQMIGWISSRSESRGYRVGLAFMSGKKELGINHKAYGVTSLGVHEYLKAALKARGLEGKRFTAKISGGPDGDVAGNELMNLIRDFGSKVKILGVIDGTGLLTDPNGIQQGELKRLFENGLGVSSFRPKRLKKGAQLLLIQERRDGEKGAQEVLSLESDGKNVSEVWMGASDANRTYSHELLSLKSDVFLPCGGRPRTLNARNWKLFCDEDGQPSSHIIVEGANLFLDDTARRELQTLGALIIKDASANKCGVICSSYEILAGLLCEPQQFKNIKEELVQEVLEKLIERAQKESQLLIDAPDGDAIAQSDEVSNAINKWTDAIAEDLQLHRNSDQIDTLYGEVVKAAIPNVLRKKFKKQILALPELYRDALISSTLASSLVYKYGTAYQPKVIHSLNNEITSGLLKPSL